jgi:hypothetical protein
MVPRCRTARAEWSSTSRRSRIRSFDGPAWFWSRDGRWEISTRDGFSLADDPRFHFATGEAFSLLRAIAPASKMRPTA